MRTRYSQGNGSIMRFAPSYLIDRYWRGGRGATRPTKLDEIIYEESDLTHASQAVRNVCDEFAAVLGGHLAGRRTTRGSGKELARADVPNSGWCVDSLTAAICAFNTTTSFEEGLIAAVNIGGDNDSIGAIFGQIGSAYYGLDAIPRRWIKRIKTPEKVGALIDLFLAILERS